MKQVILRESTSRSVKWDDGPAIVEIHLKPGVPEFLDDKTADALVSKVSWRMEIMSMSSPPAKAKRPGIRIVQREQPVEVATLPPQVDTPATEGDEDGGLHGCPHCDREFDTPQGLASHIRAKHKD